MMTLLTASNIALVVVGVARSFLITSEKRKMRFIASCTGFVSQPLWVYISIATENYGITALSAWYCYCWIRGMRNNKAG